MYESIERLKTLHEKARLYSIISIVCFFIFLSSCFQIFFKPNSNHLLQLVIGLLSLNAIFVMYYDREKLKKQCNRVAKDEIMQSILNLRFENVQFDSLGHMSAGTLVETGIVCPSEYIVGKDYIKATYKGIDFEESYVRTFYKEDSTGKDERECFSGNVFKAKYGRKDVMSVQVFSKHFKYRGKPLERYTMTQVSMESQEFNQAFDVYAASEREAFYILTPVLIEKLMDLYKKYHEIAFHFSDGFCYVADAKHESRMDLDFAKKFNYGEYSQKIEDEIQMMIDFLSIFSE